MAEPPRRFRSAGDGGQRGAPASGTTYQFAGSQERAPQVLRAILAAKRYRDRQPHADPQRGSRSSLSAAALSSLRGDWRAERRFQGETGFFDPDRAPSEPT